MSAPARHRDHYFIGRTGSFLIPTVQAADAVLRTLCQRLDRAEHSSMVERLRSDVDAVLDRRTRLAYDEATAEAIRLAREP